MVARNLKLLTDDVDKKRLGVLIILGVEAALALAKLLRILLNYCLCA